jgi:hypothetical protein
MAEGCMNGKRRGPRRTDRRIDVSAYGRARHECVPNGLHRLAQKGDLWSDSPYRLLALSPIILCP